tara:strand:+ start:270 stop:422 length:153 start_codon:yes stop_codon:yes gene_type:complete
MDKITIWNPQLKLVDPARDPYTSKPSSSKSQEKVVVKELPVDKKSKQGKK